MKEGDGRDFVVKERGLGREERMEGGRNKATRNEEVGEDIKGRGNGRVWRERNREARENEGR